MGINFYWASAHDWASPNRPDYPEDNYIHIGRRWRGHNFVVHVIKSKNITTIDDWVRVMNEEGSHVVDEDNIEVDKATVIATMRGPGDISYSEEDFF
jgi:hypothetical protein